MRRACFVFLLGLVACGGPESRATPADEAVRESSVHAGAAEAATASETERAREPERASVDAPSALLAIDTHVDTPLRMLDAGDDLATRLPDGHLDLPRMREGGLSAAFFSVWVDPRRYRGEQAFERALALLTTIRDFAAAHPDDVVLCVDAPCVRTAHAEGRIAMLVGVEGAHALGEADDETLLSRIERLAELGMRYLTLTWTGDNRFAHASTGAHPERGLTPLGRRAIEVLNRLGVIVDVSHVSDRSALEAAALSTAPVLASHSAARALADHPRNAPDEVIRAIAARGGAVCVNFYAHYLDPAYGARRRALEAEHREAFAAIRGRSWRTSERRNALAAELDPSLRAPGLDVLAAHVAHVVAIGGPGAACLGSDFDGVGELPRGMRDVSALPELLQELSHRGLDVPAIAGGNVLRVLGAQRP